MSKSGQLYDPLQLVKDFLKQNGLVSTFECLDKEWRYKQLGSDGKMDQADSQLAKMAKEYRFIKENHTNIDTQHKSMQQCARHMFAIAVNCVQEMENIKDGKKESNLNESIASYKNQIGRYHKIIMTDHLDDKTKMVNQAVLQEHKKCLLKAKDDEGVLEALLSLRLYGLDLRTSDLRRSFIDELVQGDIFYMKEKKNEFIIDLLGRELYTVKQTTLAVISMLCSIDSGVDYIISHGSGVVEQIISV
jgi:hypothetical protein